MLLEFVISQFSDLRDIYKQKIEEGYTFKSAHLEVEGSKETLKIYLTKGYEPFLLQQECINGEYSMAQFIQDQRE